MTNLLKGLLQISKSAEPLYSQQSQDNLHLKPKSKLPKAVKSWKDAKAAEDHSKQLSLDPHLEEQRKEIFIPYSDLLF